MRTSYPFGFGTGISCISYSLHGICMTRRSISLHCFSSFYMVQVRELTPCRTQLLGLPSSSLGVCRPSYLLVTVGLTGRYELEGVQYGCKFRHSRAWQDQTKMRKEPAIAESVASLWQVPITSEELRCLCCERLVDKI